MPQIKQFTADITPNARMPYAERMRAPERTGLEDLGAGIQHAAGSLMANATAEANFQTEKDVQGAYKDAALLRAQALDKLDELRQTGKPIGDQFNEWVTQQADDARQNRTTTRGLDVWDTHVTNISSELSHTARLIDADTAGNQAKLDAQARIDANGKTLQKDPTQLQNILAENAASVNALNVPPQLKQELLRHVNNEAARNAAEGFMDANPYRAKEILESSSHLIPGTLTPELREHLLDRANTKIRGIEEQQRIGEAQADKQAHLANQNLLNDLIVRAHEGKLQPKEIAALALQTDERGRPKLLPEQVNGLYNYLEREAREGPAHSDPTAMVQVMLRLGNNDITPEEVGNLVLSRDLSTTDGKQFMAAAQAGNAALKQARQLQVKEAGGKFGIMPGFEAFSSPAAIQAQASYNTWLLGREQELRKEGKSATELYTSGEAGDAIARFVPARGVTDVASALDKAADAKAPFKFPDGTMRGYVPTFNQKPTGWPENRPYDPRHDVRNWTPLDTRPTTGRGAAGTIGGPGGSKAAPSAAPPASPAARGATGSY